MPPLGANSWLPPLRWLCLLPKQDRAQASGPPGASCSVVLLRSEVQPANPS